ncbi:MAG: isochorismatase family protein [Candidatus Limnocylindria bacterium]
MVLCGISTHVVVESTAREGADRGWSMVVLEDCCTSARSLDSHRLSVKQTLPLFSAVQVSTIYLNDRIQQ